MKGIPHVIPDASPLPSPPSKRVGIGEWGGEGGGGEVRVQMSYMKYVPPFYLSPLTPTLLTYTLIRTYVRT